MSYLRLKDRLVHGSIIELRSGILGEVLALPSPPGFVAVLPKYKVCGEGPWRLGSARLCRLLASYTPEELGEAFRHIRLVHDPLYSAEMPYASALDVVRSISPLEACRRLIEGAGPEWAIEVLGEVFPRLEVSPCEEVGVAGSLAGGYYHTSSDVDLVAYPRPGKAGLIYESMSKLGEPEMTVIAYRGVFEAEARVSWRRRLVKGRRVTIVMAPVEPGAHCPPLRSYSWMEHVKGRVRAVVNVEGGQESALLYPPCVRSEDGRYIISYEYNLAGDLYEGGVFEVEGLYSGRAVLLAVRGEHTSIRRLKGNHSRAITE